MSEFSLWDDRVHSSTLGREHTMMAANCNQNGHKDSPPPLTVGAALDPSCWWVEDCSPCWQGGALIHHPQRESVC